MITGISISQDNKIGDSDLLAVHSPLIFLIDVTYTGLIPDILYCDIYNEDSELLGSFKCIPYKDLLPEIRQFMFIADGFLRGYMEGFDDFVQTEYSLVYVEDITKIFELKFRDPDAGIPDEAITFTAIHAIKQFGESPNLLEIYNNDSDLYIAAKNKPCYIYFYNNDENNIISVGAGYQVKFIIDDGANPVENVKITIEGDGKYTDSNGEAIFNLMNGAYSYVIYKESFVEKSGNFSIEDAGLLFEITLIANTQSTVTFHVEHSGTDIELALVTVKKNGDIIDSGYTDVNGDWDSLLYLDTYDITVTELSWEYEVTPFQAIITTNPQTVNVVVASTSTYPITFLVIDFVTGNPIIGAKIGNEDYAESANPNDTWKNQNTILTTIAPDGDVTVNDSLGSENCGVRAIGYSSAVKSATVTTGINLVLLRLNPIT